MDTGHPHKTHTNEVRKEKGIRMMSEERYHLAPWELALYHNNTVTRSYHATFEAAVAAKRKAERLKAKEGSRAIGYDRAAQMEYEEAKRIVGKDTALVPLLHKLASHLVSNKERKLVEIAVEEFIVVKESQGIAFDTRRDIRIRLRRFARHFTGRFLDTITGNEILTWLGTLGLKPRSIWNFYRMQCAFFAYADRRDWVDKNPMGKIDPDADLPKVRKGLVSIMTLNQGEALMRYIETNYSHLIGWACVQYFIGIRDAESERIRGEWIDVKRRRIVMPGWHLEGEESEAEGITKTRDDWIIDNIPPAFWDWVKRYPSAFAPGKLAAPSGRLWGKIRCALVEQGVWQGWPKNGFRHSFATYHLSWKRDVSATSLILRHQDTDRLWNSYLAKLVPRAVGRRYLSLPPARPRRRS